MVRLIKRNIAVNDRIIFLVTYKYKSIAQQNDDDPTMIFGIQLLFEIMLHLLQNNNNKHQFMTFCNNNIRDLKRVHYVS